MGILGAGITEIWPVFKKSITYGTTRDHTGPKVTIRDHMGWVEGVAGASWGNFFGF